MGKHEELVACRKRDIDKVVGFIGSPECKGITAARRLALTVSVLEAGRPLKEYTEGGKKEEDV